MIFDPDERLEPGDREAMRERRFGDLCARLATHPFHGPRLPAGAGLADLASLPFTTKQDLWDAYPLGLLAVDRSLVRRIHATSGTKGRPTLVAYSAGDLDLFRRVNARALAAAGAVPGTFVHNAYGYGLFTGGLGLHGGGELLGCAVVPASGGQTARQVMLIQDLRPEILCCTPSYGALLGEALRGAGVSPAANPLRCGIFGAEPFSEELRIKIEELHGLTALDIYGLCEVIGPGVAFECPESRAELVAGGRGGLHVNEDHFLPEIVDPETGEPLLDGQTGELVFTTLTKEALPLVRFRTGDISSLNRELCACGRTTVRMARIVGRADDMLVVRGVNVFPSEIEALVLASPELAPHYTIVLDTTAPMPELTVVCELDPAGAGGDPTAAGGDGAQLAGELTARLSERLGLNGRVLVGPPGAVPRTEVGKAVRIVRRTPDHDGRPPSIAALMSSGSSGTVP
jgi:phenylacetate-coenzyme A ligase PaaK-like adenylate-forming protein